MPSRQQSPSSSTSGSSTKKAGHQRNPMACTNCRARKIKCDSNKRYPDHPCQRCVTRKLVCEYVAISHTPSADTRSRSGSLNSSYDTSRKTHSSNPTQRYSPLSTSLHSRSSRPDAYPHSYSDNSHYSSSNGSLSDSSPSIEHHIPSSLYGPYSSNYGDSVLPPSSQMNHMPLRPSTPHYEGYSLPGVSPDPGRYYIRDSGYGDWNGLSMSTHGASQGQYCGECLCTPGMQCTCGNRRYY